MTQPTAPTPLELARTSCDAIQKLYRDLAATRDTRYQDLRELRALARALSANWELVGLLEARQAFTEPPGS